MEARTSEREFDDLEKLLGEIPNVTSVNPNSGGSVPKMVGLNDEGRSPLNKIHQSPVRGIRTEEMYLPDSRYDLASAFGELRFSGEQPVEAQNSPYAKSLQSYTTSLDGGFQTNVRIVPYRSPNSVPYGFYGFDVPKGGHASASLSRLNSTPELRRRHQVASCPPFDSITVPVPGVHFPVMPDQQQLVMEAQARLPYLNPQQMNQQHNINWRKEEEQIYAMQQQYIHLQKLHNQHLENGNVASRILSAHARQPHFEGPIPQQYEQFKPEPFRSGYGMPKSSNHSNLACNQIDLNAMKTWDKVGKPSYPDKILARPLGFNTSNAVRFGSVGVNESRSHVTQNGKVHPNGSYVRSLSDSGCYQLNNVGSWDLYPDLSDLQSDDMKSPPIKYDSLNEVSGKIYLMAKDQYGCRFLQRKFVEGTKEEIEMIFNEIIDDIIELMTDAFGNYLVQKLLEVCDNDQMMKILESVTRNPRDLFTISCDTHGTRAVQKIIETLQNPEQFSLVVSSLEPHAVALMTDMNGNHVAQKCLQHLMPQYNEFLFVAAIVNCVELAKDRHGCCVLQKCLAYSDGERRRRLIHEISSNALLFSQDPYGNYVVQFVFDLRLSWATDEILDHLDGCYGDLSTQKHSSNVVERCLKCADEERHTRIVQEIIDHPRLDQIMTDAFGNYVIQAVLNQSKGALYSQMVDAIKPHVPMLRNSPYGKKVLACLGLRK